MSELSVRTRSMQRAAIFFIIVSLSVTAVIGIVALLTDSLDDTNGKVMLTTLAVGIFSVISLCDLSVLGRRHQWLGVIGIAVSAVALTFSLILIWGAYFDSDAAFLWKTFWLSTIAGLSLAQVNLLLLVLERCRPALRIGLWATISLIGSLALLLALLVTTEGQIGTGAYTRLLGTVAILDVLGTVVVPVVSKFLRDSGVDRPARSIIVLVPDELGSRLDALATERETTPEKLALVALEKL